MHSPQQPGGQCEVQVLASRTMQLYELPTYGLTVRQKSRPTDLLLSKYLGLFRALTQERSLRSLRPFKTTVSLVCRWCERSKKERSSEDGC